jgi:hypothetical protein
MAHRRASLGTVNALFRLGDDLVLRFPLRPGAATGLRLTQEHVRRIAPHLPLAVPEAIVQAIVALPYHAGTNPVMAATARDTLSAILA